MAQRFDEALPGGYEFESEPEVAWSNSYLEMRRTVAIRAPLVLLVPSVRHIGMTAAAPAPVEATAD